MADVAIGIVVFIEGHLTFTTVLHQDVPLLQVAHVNFGLFSSNALYLRDFLFGSKCVLFA
jgi:hypothetical protein